MNSTARDGIPTFFRNRKVGLALGSGAARGLSFIGVLEALETAGVGIDYIAGTSIGALIGALYASGVPVRKMVEVASRLNWRQMAMLLDPIIPTSGLIDGKKVVSFIGELLPKSSFESLDIPLAITATDIETGELIVIRQGNLIKAIEAAVAFPGIFAPVPFSDRFLVDGGLCAPVPTDVVRNMGAETVIGVCAIPEVKKHFTETSTPAAVEREKDSTGFLERFNPDWIEKRFRDIWQEKINRSKPAAKRDLRKPPGILRVFSQSIAIMENQINALRMERDHIDLMIRPDLNGIKLLDFHRAREIIERGKSAAQGAVR